MNRKNTFELVKIAGFLVENGFENVTSEVGRLCYDNGLVAVYPAYDKTKDTVIISTSTGQELAFLPTCYYSILGWLIEANIIGFTYKRPKEQ